MSFMEFFTITKCENENLIGKVGFIAKGRSNYFSLFIIGGVGSLHALTVTILVCDMMDKIVVRPFKAGESFNVVLEAGP